MTERTVDFKVDEASDEVKAVDGNGNNIIEPMAIPSYGLDYKKILADELIKEYKANGINDKVLKLVYIAIAETWSVE